MVAGGPAPTEDSAPTIGRLPFVDGIRGLAALVVLGTHCLRVAGYFGSACDGPQLCAADVMHASSGERAAWAFWPGPEMVLLFLLVSGFSLAYSEDRRRLSDVGTRLVVFARRRLWRILPTYYLALAFGLVVLALVPHHFVDAAPVLRDGLPVAPWSVLSHVFFLQDTSHAWFYKENPPLWSMAYELQLYLVFPLLYWASRRWSAVGTALIAITVDFVVHRATPDLVPFGLLRWFALGILIAHVYRSRAVARVPTALLATVGLVSLAMAYANFASLRFGVKHDVVWGLAFTALLVAMSRRPESRRNPMNWFPIRWVGARSYSLYALHFPVLWLVYPLLVMAGVTDSARPWILLLVATPLAILVATAAYRWVELPTLRRAHSTERATATKRIRTVPAASWVHPRRVSTVHGDADPPR